MKKSEDIWMLDRSDLSTIKQLYRNIWESVGEMNGLAWYLAVMEFIEMNDLELVLKETPKRRRMSITAEYLRKTK